MTVTARAEPTIRSVVVADALPLFRDALARVVRTSPVLRVAAEATDAAATCSALRRLRPDLAVVGAGPAPPGNGAATAPAAHDAAAATGIDLSAVLRCVSAEQLPTRVVALLDPADRDVAYRAIASGAAGCVTRLAEPAEVTDALALAARGGVHVARELQAPIADEIRFRERARHSLLSERETVVLRAVASGRSAAQIALDLHLGITTVKTHLRNAYEKLGVSDRAAAVAIAIRRGLLD